MEKFSVRPIFLLCWVGVWIWWCMCGLLTLGLLWI